MNLPGKNLFTFWSMEPPYAEKKLRYHLGQIAMLERMAKNIEGGGRSSAVICDPPVILSARSRPDAKQQRDAIAKFIRQVGDPSIEVFLLSDLNSDFRGRDEVKYGFVESQLLLSFTKFNLATSNIKLSPQAQSDLKPFRSGEVREVPFSLKAALGKLRENIGGDDRSLLTTLYAFNNRASWFDSHHMAATAATLSILNEVNDDPRPPVILEASRNAYPWVILKFLYDHAIQRDGIQEKHWPELELCVDVPDLDGKSFMRLSERAGCLFLDEPYKDHANSLSCLSENFLKVFAERFPDFVEKQEPQKFLRDLFGTYRKRALRAGLLQNVKNSDPEDSDNVNLILGGGGAKGIALVSATAELWNHYTFTHFWGTSAGSIVAVLLGAGFTPAELDNVLTTTSFESFLDRGLLRQGWNLIRHGGLHTAAAFEPWLDGLLRSRLGTHGTPLMKDLTKRTTIFASQGKKGTIAFDSWGDNKDAPASFAVRSSISYPFFFTPGKLYGNPVYDGGVINNFPLKQFKLSNTGTAFIGIALRSTAPHEPKTWHRFIPATAKDLLSIWTVQDEDTLFDEHKDNMIVLDTNPVGTFDIALKRPQINYLTALGRSGAHRFLFSRGLENKASVDAWSKQVDTLRKQLSVTGSER